MKTIGMIGGMSWESSLEYYRLINELVKTRLGGLHSARTLMFSFDFEEIEALQREGDWAGLTKKMVQVAVQLESGGADFIIICTNTMHKMAGDVQTAVDIPLLHIADATAERILKRGLTRIGLLGTNYTMVQDFYKGRLTNNYGLDVLIPDASERQDVHNIIYDELCLGVIKESSRQRYRQVISEFVAQGAEGIILGCTEIGLLVKQEDSSVPVFDTTLIHAEAAVDFALSGDG